MPKFSSAGDVHFQAFDFRHTQDIPPRAETDQGEA